MAQVNELLLAAAAALPEGDVLRVAAEALAARARRAASMGYGNESCPVLLINCHNKRILFFF
jgi:hypothetical protein